MMQRCSFRCQLLRRIRFDLAGAHLPAIGMNLPAVHLDPATLQGEDCDRGAGQERGSSPEAKAGRNKKPIEDVVSACGRPVKEA